MTIKDCPVCYKKPMVYLEGDSERLKVQFGCIHCGIRAPWSINANRDLAEVMAMDNWDNFVENYQHGSLS